MCFRIAFHPTQSPFPVCAFCSMTLRAIVVHHSSATAICPYFVGQEKRTISHALGNIFAELMTLVQFGQSQDLQRSIALPQVVIGLHCSTAYCFAQSMHCAQNTLSLSTLFPSHLSVILRKKESITERVRIQENRQTEAENYSHSYILDLVDPVFTLYSRHEVVEQY